MKTELSFIFSFILLIGLIAIALISSNIEEVNTEPKENFISSTSVLWNEQIVSVEHDGHLFVVIATTDRGGGLGIAHHPDCTCKIGLRYDQKQ